MPMHRSGLGRRTSSPPVSQEGPGVQAGEDLELPLNATSEQFILHIIVKRLATDEPENSQSSFSDTIEMFEAVILHFLDLFHSHNFILRIDPSRHKRTWTSAALMLLAGASESAG
jgi:hypothetical protein